MTTQALSVSDLANAFREAFDAAQCLSTRTDGGTCNLDSVAIPLAFYREAKLLDAAKLSERSIRVNAFTWFGKRWAWIRFDEKGQGARRTAMVEAAHRVLRACGVECSIYYQMD